MKYALYEDPLTHKFAFLPVPSRFIEGDPLPIVGNERWFVDHAQAIAALLELLNREDPEAGLNGAAQAASPSPS